MSKRTLVRKLTAILYADIAGYSRLTGQDELGTHQRVMGVLDFASESIKESGGTVLRYAGDAILAEFPSVVGAVEVAVDVQKELAKRNVEESSDTKIQIRMGLNLGEVLQDRGEIYGDGVNLAARLESAAKPGGVCISASVFDQVSGKVDIDFEDGGEEKFKNIEKPVHVYHWHPDGSNNAERSQGSLPDIPSIAVLPFANISGDPEQEFFADGLVEDIITTLSKLAGLRVIARNSTFVYKGQAVDIRQAAKQLGVRYVLEGSVRKSANRIRITAQLIEADSGSHVWAERYDRAVADIFAVQDEITLVLATEMQVKLTEGEQARLHYTTTSNVEAWTNWVEGLSYYRQSVTKENVAAAHACWKRALALDPTSAALNAMVGFIHYIDARFGWWDDRETAVAKAREYADRALELDPENPATQSTSSMICLLERRFEEAAVHARRAVQLAPGSADATSFACFALSFAGYPEEAVSHGERARTLSPNYPAYYLGHLGNAYRLAGRFEEAIAAFKAYHARYAGFGLSDLVIAYQQTNQPEQAKQTAEQLLSIRRDFTIAAWANTQFRADTASLEADIAALRAAGLPTN